MTLATKPWPPAVFSPDERYRYLLSRRVGMWPGACLFIMLNPSTADILNDDPTIRRCIRFCQRWGYGTLLVANLFALRGTNPNILRTVDDPVGENNMATIRAVAKEVDKVVVAYGVQGAYLDQDKAVLAMLEDIDLYCLGTTDGGYPRHPLYVRHDQELELLRGKN